MGQGKIIQQGSPAQVYTSPLSAATAMSTGDVLVLKAKKFIDGKTDYILNPIKTNGQIGEIGQVVIRPEEIRISNKISDQAISGKIKKIDYYGHDAMITVAINDELVQVRTAAPLDFQVGQAVAVEHFGPVRFFASN
jgi:iron(III) transport system ATP-binding protein